MDIFGIRGRREFQEREKEYQEQKTVKEKARAELFKELSSSSSKIYQTVDVSDYNPDDLVGKKGLIVYKNMIKDDQVKACITMKKFARLSTKWEIVPAIRGDKLHQEIAEFVNLNFVDLKGTFENALFEIYSALEYGFSITELVYKILENGKFKGKIGLKALKTREPFDYNFRMDKFGNLAEDGLELVGEKYPIDKFIIYSYNKQFDNWYGNSDLRAAYRSWWSKDIIIRFHNIFLERFGMPTLIAKYPEGVFTDEEIKKLREEVLDNLQAKTSITAPEGLDISLLEAKRGGDAGFKDAIEMHNKYIARAILVPDLLGFTGVPSPGSYALGKKHFDVFLWVLEKLGRDTEESIVGEQIIKKLVDYNYNVDVYPRFVFESLTEENTEARSKIIHSAVELGMVSPEEDWIRPYLGLPKRETAVVEEKPENPEEKDVEPKQQFQEYAETRFEKKVDFKALEKYWDDAEDFLLKKLQDVVKKQKDNLLSYVERKKIIENKDFTSVNELDLRFVNDFRNVLRNILIKIYLDSKLKTLRELLKGGLPLTITTKFAEIPFEMWEPVPPATAIEFFDKKVNAYITTEDGKKIMITFADRKILNYYNSKALAISGVEKENILKEAKIILQRGIKEGQALKGVQFSLGEIFKKYLETGEIKDKKLITPSRLETIVRTNESEAMNTGRMDMFNDSVVKDFVPYVQWMAVLDRRTSPYCEGMDGRIFKRDDPDVIPPPAHFNCRSILSAITSMEVEKEVKADKGITVSKPLPKEQRGVGFYEKENKT